MERADHRRASSARPSDRIRAPDADLVELPSPARSITERALDELELVYAFVYSRVGNRADAEDVTQQIALEALPQLREQANSSQIRGYLFASARSALVDFWSYRLGSAEMPSDENFPLALPEAPPSEAGVEAVNRVLSRLTPNQRRVLELRFLLGYSLKEVAAEMNSTVPAVKVMQLRALRSAAQVPMDDG